MIKNLKKHMRAVLACFTVLLSFSATLSHAAIQDCSINCLRVYSIELVDTGTSIDGTVKLVDETGSGGAINGEF